MFASQLLRVYSRKMSRLPELIRQQRKRALGQPRTGRMSLVMTDIQGFTQLMQGAPDQTTQVSDSNGWPPIPVMALLCLLGDGL